MDLTGLTVGYYETDGFLEPSSSVKRAVREACDALRSAGAGVISFKPPNVEELLYLHLSALSGDGGHAVDANLAGKPIIEPLRLSRRIAHLPRGARRMAANVLQMRGESRVAEMLRSIGPKNVAEYWEMTDRRDSLIQAENHRWRADRIDALVCPAQLTAAVTHGMGKDFVLSFAYSARYNLLNLPAGVVPVTRVRPGETARSQVEDRVDRRAAAAEDGSEGLPVGVQVVARPWREDVALALMTAIETTVSDHPDFPKVPITPSG